MTAVFLIRHLKEIRLGSVKRFKSNLKEMFRLVEIHGEITGDKAGRRHNVEVLNKAAIVVTHAGKRLSKTSRGTR